MRKLRYQFITKSPLHVGGGAHDERAIDFPTLKYVPGYTVKGALRHVFRLIYEDNEELESNLFGSRGKVGSPGKGGSFFLSQLKVEGKSKTETRVLTRIDRKTGKVPKNNLLFKEFLVEGTVLSGEIAFEESLPGLHVALAVTALRSIGETGIAVGSGIGGLSNKGYGRCDVEISGRENMGRVFMSYSWEDKSHNEWVAQLVGKLSEDGFDTTFDRSSLSFDDEPPKNVIDEFMTRGILDSDNVIAVLTPGFKRKYERGGGGVGFETSIIRDEPVSDPVLNRVVTVLRRGNEQDAIPNFLDRAKRIDMRESNSLDEVYSKLVQLLRV